MPHHTHKRESATHPPTWPLSFKMTIMRERKYPAQFRASKAMPPVMAPSPMTAMQLLTRLPVSSLPTDIPWAAEMEVLCL